MPLSLTPSAADSSADTSNRDPGAELMLAYQAGDERAFDGLVERYAGPIYSLLTRFLGPIADREDLVQEVFMRVLGAKDRYTAGSRFTTYLYRIAFNLSMNHRERAGRRRTETLDGGSRAEETGARPELADGRIEQPSVGLERADLVQAVRDAIAALPERQRMALLLAKYEGLPYAEIGRVLDLSEAGVKSLIHRARETLRDNLPASLLEELP